MDETDFGERGVGGTSLGLVAAAMRRLSEGVVRAGELQPRT